MSWLHADVVMLFCGLVVATLVAVLITAEADEVRRAWWVVLGVTLAQGFIGYVQYFTALPIVLVLLHMLGASLLVAGPHLGRARDPSPPGLTARTATVGWIG